MPMPEIWGMKPPLLLFFNVTFYKMFVIILVDRQPDPATNEANGSFLLTLMGAGPVRTWSGKADEPIFIFDFDGT